MKEAAAAVGLEALHHVIPLLLRGTPPCRKSTSRPKVSCRCALQDLAHLGELGEDQRPVPDCRRTSSSISVRRGQLAGAARQPGSCPPGTGRGGCRPA